MSILFSRFGLNRLLVLVSFVPFFLSCQEEKVPIQKVEDVGELVLFSLSGRSTNFCTSGQLYESGLGVVDMKLEKFLYRKSPESEIDTLGLPEGFNLNFYNVIPCPNGKFYFLDPELGLFELTKQGAQLIDSINNHAELSRDGLMILNTITTRSFAVFVDEHRLIIPTTWNFDNPQGKYKSFKKPIPRYCEYNLLTKELRLLDFMTPMEVFKLNYAGYEREYYTCVTNDTLIMSMPYTSEIRLFSISQNKEIGKIVCQSVFQEGPIKQFKYRMSSSKGKLNFDRYDIETPVYGPIYYNNQRKEYYRIFYHGLPQKNAKGEYTVYEDKRLSIMVMDEKLKLKKEISFENDVLHVCGLTCTKRGFIINNYIKVVDGKKYNVEVVL